MNWNTYWGDLHSHCSISYGEGTVQQALGRARQQLDFCSVTGHAFWPDMPTDRARYGQIIDYHRRGFATLAGNWDLLLSELARADRDHEFVTFPSYEWHSLQYGDHNVYSADPHLPLRDAPDLPGLRQLARESRAILVPHHIGYAAGYRGIDWRHFREERSPIVEVYSLHGASVSEDAPYPMLHDMGPRDAGSTAEAGWEAGHHFGIIASTDHHGGYPGSHGDGRVAVLARQLTRESLWEAILARRVYAVTGDKILASLELHDAPIGSIVKAPGTRRLRFQVTAMDSLDRVELVKNGRVAARFFPPASQGVADSRSRRYRLRLTWGWGRKDEPVIWHGHLTLSDGELLHAEPCFSGQSIVAPQGVGGHTQAADQADLPHQATMVGRQRLEFRSVTTGNLSTRHPTTQAVSLELEAPLTAQLTVAVGGRSINHSLADLLHAGRAHYLRGWLSEAIRIGPLVPAEELQLEGVWEDRPTREEDRYLLRVAQQNGQWAWLTPIWATP